MINKLASYWISPEGKEFEVPQNMTHKEYAKKNFNEDEKKLITSGWIRMAYVNLNGAVLAIQCRGKELLINLLKKIQSLLRPVSELIVEWGPVKDVDVFSLPGDRQKLETFITGRSQDRSLDRFLEQLEKLTNKKVVLLEQENIFIPRHETDNRQEKYLQKINKILQQEVFVGDLDLRNLPITSLGNLREVTGSLYLENTKITSLGNLEKVEYLDLENTKITSLGNLREVVGSLNLQNTPITSLGNLRKVTRSLDLQNTPITSLGKLEKVGYLNLQNTKITSLGNLRKVSSLDLRNTPISKDPKLLKYYQDKFKDVTIQI